MSTTRDYISVFNQVEKIKKTPFNIENLFTYIPLLETIKFCLLKLLQQNGSVNRLTKEIFGILLDHAVMNSFFMFSGEFYK